MSRYRVRRARSRAYSAASLINCSSVGKGSALLLLPCMKGLAKLGLSAKSWSFGLAGSILVARAERPAEGTGTEPGGEGARPSEGKGAGGGAEGTSKSMGIGVADCFVEAGSSLSLGTFPAPKIEAGLPGPTPSDLGVECWVSTSTVGVADVVGVGVLLGGMRSMGTLGGREADLGTGVGLLLLVLLLLSFDSVRVVGSEIAREVDLTRGGDAGGGGGGGEASALGCSWGEEISCVVEGEGEGVGEGDRTEAIEESSAAAGDCCW
mmetsp:Transcript_5840/g.8987  ORF Transcript_5840/g.8987 Transcript_5840/m.8987 type:complete len:265 (+) Transcript_5840:2640-3434(+)